MPYKGRGGALQGWCLTGVVSSRGGALISELFSHEELNYHPKHDFEEVCFVCAQS